MSHILLIYTFLHEIRTKINTGHDIKQSDGEISVMLEFWGMWSTPLLLSLSGSLLP